jgi:hypothetical protein
LSGLAASALRPVRVARWLNESNKSDKTEEILKFMNGNGLAELRSRPLISEINHLFLAAVPAPV